MTKRIGMILDTDFPPDSRVENEAFSLIEAGFEVYLFSLSYVKRLEQEDIRGIQVRRYSANKLTYKLSALAYTLPFYHWLVREDIRDFLVKNDIEIIHVHDILIARAVWDVKPGGLPLVLDLHENRPEIMKQYRHVNTTQGRFLINPQTWEKYQNRFIKEADRIVVVTEHARQDVLEQNLKESGEIISVPNTVHPDIFNQYPVDKDIMGRFEDDFNVLYLGDTGLRRGTDTAIRAMCLLADKIPNLKLIFVGENKEDIILKKLVKDLGLDDKVIFEGWQDVSKFPSYIKASHVCISPLKRNKHHDTTFANKLFQYMAMGRPVIVSDCPPQAEVISEHKAGLIHHADDHTELADNILELHADEALRIQMGKNAEKAIQDRWNWKNTCKDLVEMYSQFE